MNAGVCQPFDLGHACDNNGQCLVGLCKSGTCSPSEDGDSCVEQYQCTGAGQVCGIENRKCYVPSDQSVYPADICQRDSQCLNGNCTNQVEIRTPDGLITAYPNDYAPTYPVPPPSHCSYFADGFSGCRSYRDCADALCLDGTCKLGKSGDRCLVNYQCEGLCGLDGICFDPPTDAKYGVNQPAKLASQCLSGQLQGPYDSYITRPSLDDPSKPARERDSQCSASDTGASCNADNDCTRGKCNDDNICALVLNGGSCTSGSQCETQTCNKDSGTCETAGSYDPCAKDSDCFSGECRLGCYEYLGYDCPDKFCRGIGLGSTCRNDGDCEAGACTADKKCFSPNGGSCYTGEVCLSGYCNDSSLCDDPPASLSTTSTTTTTSMSAASTTSQPAASDSSSMEQSSTSTTAAVTTSTTSTTEQTSTKVSISTTAPTSTSSSA
ncbi:hypothetical protein CF327_g4112 [Tilletia walkeri]|nr:hypothetical protein CF327_g4112 [Tilletia walkeri]